MRATYQTGRKGRGVTYAREIRIPVRAWPYSPSAGIVLINTPVNSRREYAELIRLVQRTIRHDRRCICRAR